MAGFGVFALQQILPVCFAALSAPHFNLNNAAALQLLDSIVALQKAMLTLLGAQQLVPYLRDTHLPSLGCEPAFCAHYVTQPGRGAVLAAPLPRHRGLPRLRLVASGLALPTLEEWSCRSAPRGRLGSGLGLGLGVGSGVAPCAG